MYMYKSWKYILVSPNPCLQTLEIGRPRRPAKREIRLEDPKNRQLELEDVIKLSISLLEVEFKKVT